MKHSRKQVPPLLQHTNSKYQQVCSPVCSPPSGCRRPHRVAVCLVPLQAQAHIWRVKKASGGEQLGIVWVLFGSYPPLESLQTTAARCLTCFRTQNDTKKTCFFLYISYMISHAQRCAFDEHRRCGQIKYLPTQLPNVKTATRWERWRLLPALFLQKLLARVLQSPAERAHVLTCNVTRTPPDLALRSG